MKKLHLLVILIGLAATSFAQGTDRSILKIRLADNGPITVSIDNRYYNKQGRSLIIGDLPGGRHRIKIYRYNGYRNENGGSARTLYSGSIKLESGLVVSLVYDADSRDMRLQSSRIGEQVDRASDNTNEDNSRYDNNSQYNAEPPSENTGNTGRLASQEITELQARVADKITDGDKEKLMESELSSRAYTTEQVRGMLGWLGFESTRVEFAKWAYDNVTDKQNYPKLESEFSFTGSKDEFNKYISAKKK